MTVEDLTIQAPDGEALILCSVTTKGFGNRRKVEPRDLGLPESISEEMFSVSKKLLDAPELRAVNTAINNFVDFVRSKSVPATAILKKGVYAVGTKKAAGDIWQAYKAFKAPDGELARLKEALRKAYPARMAEAREKLTSDNGRSFFDPSQYPPVDSLLARFDVTVRFFTMRLPDVGGGIVAEQGQEIAEDLQTLIQDARILLRNELLQFTVNLRDALDLKPGAKKRPRIYESTVNKVLSFITDFAERNPIARDAELKEIVGRLSEVMTGVDTEALRNSDFLRMKVKQDLDAVTDRLSSLAQCGSTERAVILED